MSLPIIEAKQLCIKRDHNKVIDSVSFKVHEGDIFALLGGNGAGKTTTLLTFLGFLTPVSGEACLFGYKVTQNLAKVREKSAYLPELCNLYGHLSAQENLRYFLSLAGIKRSPKEIAAALDRVLLTTNVRTQKLDSYSKGMRQKVAISLALLRKAPILLLDEPTSGLDPLAIDEFNQLLLDLASEGTTVLMVTHDVYGACHVADHIGLLKNGCMMDTFKSRYDQANNKILIDPETVHKAFIEQANHA